MKIAITTSSFGKYSIAPIELLRKNNVEYKVNTSGQKLNKDELIYIARDCDGIIAGTEEYNKETIDSLPGLKVISRCGSGVDSIDLEYAKKRSIKVLTTADGPTDAVAELTIGLILNLLRQINNADREIRKGNWEKPMGSLLKGKTIGLIGLGKIGNAVAKLAKSLGAKICYYDPNIKKSVYIKTKSLNDILTNADIVSLHVPLTKENTNLINKEMLAKMKQSAFLINCSRGGIVNEDDLYAALKEKRIAGAAIDVYTQEPYKGRLIELDNIILTSHIGSYAREVRVQMETAAVNNLIKYFKNNKRGRK